MSYVLDALKRSERERRAGTVPGLSPGASYMVAPATGEGRHGVAIAGAVTLMVAGFALGTWHPWGQSPAEPVHASAAPSPAAPVVAVAVPLPAVPVQTIAAPSPAEPPPLVPPVEAPALSLAPSLQPVAVDEPPAKPPAPARKAEAAVPKPRVKAAAAPRVEEGNQTVNAAPVGARTMAALPKAGHSSSPSHEVVAFRDLPSDVQQRLPAISFGGFAGVDEGETRIALINSRLVKEGEEVSPGLKLERVDSTGVVLGYQGYRFRP